MLRSQNSITLDSLVLTVETAVSNSRKPNMGPEIVFAASVNAPAAPPSIAAAVAASDATAAASNRPGAFADACIYHKRSGQASHCTGQCSRIKALVRLHDLGEIDNT